mgnify:CR=1 FL=1
MVLATVGEGTSRILPIASTKISTTKISRMQKMDIQGHIGVATAMVAITGISEVTAMEISVDPSKSPNGKRPNTSL